MRGRCRTALRLARSVATAGRDAVGFSDGKQTGAKRPFAVTPGASAKEDRPLACLRVCAYDGNTMNTRLAVAAHILTFLHTYAGNPVTSELLASSINTDPSLVRRLLTQLGKAGLTQSRMGTGGGALPALPADQITLLDVLRALGGAGEVLPLHPSPNPACPIGRNIGAALNLRGPHRSAGD